MLAEVKRQREFKKDYIVPNTHMRAEFNPGHTTESERGVVLTLDTNTGEKHFSLAKNGHQQLATYLNINKEYYDRMFEKNPDLLLTNINSWLEHDPEKARFVRTLDDKVRALLSPSYQVRDNDALAIMTLEMIKEKEARIRSSHIDENKIYIKTTLPELNLPDPGPRREGQLIEAGVVVSNSEVGLGSVRVDPMAYLLACLNGMVSGTALRKYHVGRAREVFSDETRKAEEETFWMQVRDVLNSSFDEERFTALVEQMKEAGEKEIPRTASIQGIVEKTVKDNGLPIGLTDDILNTFIADTDLTKYGLMNAVTNVANRQENYEVSTKLERTGGKVLEMSNRDWESLLRAEPKRTH